MTGAVVQASVFQIGWETRLLDEVALWSAKPFAWTSDADCAAFGRACLVAMAGHHPFGAIPRYSTRVGAARALKAKGHADLHAALAAHFEEVHVALAQRGDLGLVQHDGQDAIAVNLGSQWVARAEQGVFVVPVDRVHVVFGVRQCRL